MRLALALILAVSGGCHYPTLTSYPKPAGHSDTADAVVAAILGAISVGLLVYVHQQDQR
jgi:hypothetical protein